jgi:hypothetical protein
LIKNELFSIIYYFILELQLARTCCEDARTIDPYNLDSMDIFSNILFVLVSEKYENIYSIIEIFSRKIIMH